MQIAFAKGSKDAEHLDRKAARAAVSTRGWILELVDDRGAGRSGDGRGCGRDVRAQEILRWKLKAGDVLRYTTEQKMEMKVKGSTVRERKQTRSQTNHFSWNVKEVANDGVAEILLRIDRMSMRVEAPPFMPLEFDSTKADAEVPEPFEGEARN